jgi:hypothetical protein
MTNSARRILSVSLLVIFALFLPLSISSAQNAARIKVQKPPFPGKALSPQQLTTVRDNDCPIVIFPGGKGFPTLQAAIDRVNAIRNRNKGMESRFLLVIQPGSTMQGNYTLPGDIQIIGLGGPQACSIYGQPGVNQPVIKYTATNPGNADVKLIGLRVHAPVATAIEFHSNGIDAGFEITNCRIDTASTQSDPAIRISGGGATFDDKMSLRITHSWLEADDGGGDGPAIAADTTSFSEIFVQHCEFESSGICVDVGAQAAGTTDLIILDTVLQGCVNGVIASNLAIFYLVRTVVFASEDVILITDVANADIQYSYLRTDLGYGLKVLTGSTGSIANVAFNGFLSPQTIVTDAGSTTKACLNHHNFTAF